MPKKDEIVKFQQKEGGSTYRSVVTATAPSSGNADTVDGFHASATAIGNTLLALDSNAELPTSVTGDAGSVDGYDSTELAILAEADTITGLWTFSRSTAAPFACVSGAAYVQYLDADKVDGYEGSELAVLDENETITGTWDFPATGFTIGTDVGWKRSAADTMALLTDDSIQSASFTSGVEGWRIEDNGDAEFFNVIVRGELHAAVFVKDLIEAHAGTLVVTKSSGVLSYDVAVPGAGTWEIYINDPPGGGFLFDNSDICTIKSEYAGGVAQIWFTVSARTDEGDGTQSYTCTYDSGTRSITYPKGAPVIDFGVSGDGFVSITADDVYGYGPNLSVMTHAGAPWTTNTLQGRIGNLNGAYGIGANDYYGIGLGNYSSGNYLLYDTNDGFLLSAGDGDVGIDGDGIRLTAGGTTGPPWSTGDIVWLESTTEVGGITTGYFSGTPNYVQLSISADEYVSTDDVIVSLGAHSNASNAYLLAQADATVGANSYILMGADDVETVWVDKSGLYAIKGLWVGSYTTTPIDDCLHVDEVAYIGYWDDANSNMTYGVTINQSTAVDEVLCLKNSGISHGGDGSIEDDTFGAFMPYSSAGGLLVTGLRDGTAAAAVVMRGYLDGTTDGTKTTAGRGLVEIHGAQLTGAGALENVQANGNVFVIRAYKGGAWSSIFLVDEDGDLFTGGTITTASGDYWDLADYTASAPSATGYVTVTINGTAYKLLAAPA